MDEIIAELMRLVMEEGDPEAVEELKRLMYEGNEQARQALIWSVSPEGQRAREPVERPTRQAPEDPRWMQNLMRVLEPVSDAATAATDVAFAPFDRMVEGGVFERIMQLASELQGGPPGASATSAPAPASRPAMSPDFASWLIQRRSPTAPADVTGAGPREPGREEIIDYLLSDLLTQIDSARAKTRRHAAWGTALPDSYGRGGVQTLLNQLHMNEELMRAGHLPKMAVPETGQAIDRFVRGVQK